jgi:hypothetical protein
MEILETKHFANAGGWKKFEPLWNFLIKTNGLNKMLPLLESILSKVNKQANQKPTQPFSPFLVTLNTSIKTLNHDQKFN